MAVVIFLVAWLACGALSIWWGFTRGIFSDVSDVNETVFFSTLCGPITLIFCAMFAIADAAKKARYERDRRQILREAAEAEIEREIQRALRAMK